MEHTDRVRCAGRSTKTLRRPLAIRTAFRFPAAGMEPFMTARPIRICERGAVIVHVPNHFMAINAYNSANGTYLVYDSAAKPERNTTASGTWLTAAQLQSNSLTVIDWFCLVSAAGTPPQTQQYKLMATSVGEGIPFTLEMVEIYNGGAGDLCSIFRRRPALIIM